MVREVLAAPMPNNDLRPLDARAVSAQSVLESAALVSRTEVITILAAVAFAGIALVAIVYAPSI
jgi:hypothetical protein